MPLVKFGSIQAPSSWLRHQSNGAVTRRRIRGIVVVTALLTLATARDGTAQCEIQRVVSPDGPAGNLFGGAGAVFDGRVVVPGPTADRGIGAAYVFRLEQLSWELEARLAVTHPNDPFNFGTGGVAVSAETIFIATPRATGVEPRTGAVYVFELRHSTWESAGSIIASDGSSGDNFGSSIATRGPITIVGADRDTVDGLFRAGSAYIFRNDGSGWREVVRLTDPAPGERDGFGRSVAIAEDTVVVGASGDNQRTGAAFVYRLLDGEWILDGVLRASDGTICDRFGRWVAIWQDVIVVGAPNDSAPETQSGSAYVFRLVDGEWIQEQKLVGDDSARFDEFGFSIDIEVGGILIGAPGHNANTGAAYLFRRNATTGWTQTAKLLGSAQQPVDRLGSAVLLSADNAMVGAPGQSERPGSAYFFVGASDRDCDRDGEPDACEVIEGTGDDDNSNGVLDECEERGDLNGDGAVRFDDLLLLLESWGQCRSPCPPACIGDIDRDCEVNVDDLLVLLANWTG